MADPVTDKTTCTAGFRRLDRLLPGAFGYFHVHVHRSEISVHEWFDAHGLRTTAWTFDGEMPGKVIEVQEEHTAVVYYENRLHDIADKPFAMAYLPPDPPTPPPPQRPGCPVGTNSNMGGMLTTPGGMPHADWIANGLMPHIVPHLHGTVAPAAYDGNPGVTNPIMPGERKRFIYPNRQRAALLWYHDHSFGQTAGTVYAGLAAPYVIRGRRENELAQQYGLPTGSRELFLVLQTKDFEGDQPTSALTGRFSYAVSLNKEFSGAHFLTNGRLRPKLAVEQQPYRVRILNATNGRFLKLFFRSDLNGPTTVDNITWIGCDGGLLPSAIPADNAQGIFLPTAGRADLVIDFSKFAPGSWQLVNRIEDPTNPYHTGSGDNQPDTPIEVVMQFEVGPANAKYQAFIPPANLANDIPTLQSLRDDILAGRISPRDVVMELTEVGDPPMQFINGKGFDQPLIPSREQFQLGEWVRLRIRNCTPDSHPIHLHLVSFWVLGRSVNLFAPTQEAGLLDTVWCPPGENDTDAGVDTTILIHFPTHHSLAGQYMFHCHILEHEDHDMMRPFETATSVAPPPPTTHGEAFVPAPAMRRKAGGP